MNAPTMKLESRQNPTPTNEDISKNYTDYKKCKNVKKKNCSINSDKDALLNSHGLGRTLSDDADLNFTNLNPSIKNETLAKIRSKKTSPKLEKMVTNSDKIQERLQQSLSNEDKDKIMTILNDIRALSDVEKLYLYLQLPTGSSTFDVDPFKHKNLNPLGKKADEEGIFAVTWIQSHLEEDPDVSLPKQEVYDEYQSYCNMTGTDPLCAADFGKVMKQIFPSVKPRRLGTRGNSRYCYSGLRKKVKLLAPTVPDIHKEKENCSSEDKFSDEVTAAACHLLFEWAEKLLGIRFGSVKELASHLVENMYVDNRSVAAFTVLLDASPELLSKGLSSANNEGGVKKTEAQFHLHRKIQEKELIKEQKRKLQEQRSGLVVSSSKGGGKGGGTTTKKKASRKNRTLSSPLDLLCEEEKPIVNLQDQGKNKTDKSHENVDLKKSDSTLLPAKESNIPHAAASQTNGTILNINIKKEDSYHPLQINETVSNSKKADTSPSSLLVSPSSSPSSRLGDVEEMKKKAKSLIPQNKTPVCIAQSLPGIIIVPSLPHLTSEVGKHCTNTPKYKRIQPKPLQGEVFSNVVRSRAGSVGSSLPSKPKVRHVDGRRSSHAWLQSDSIIENNDETSIKSSMDHFNAQFKSVLEKTENIVLKNTLYDASSEVCNLLPESSKDRNSLLNEKQKKKLELQLKSRLVIQTNDLSEDIGPAKRHLDENDDHTDNKRFHLDLLKLSGESVQTINASKIRNILNAQVSSNQHTGIGHEEVNVHEIEGDALNDYFRGANNQVCLSTEQQSDMEQQLSSTSKVQQLSQLRMLLEQNLPSAISKASLCSVKSQKVSKGVDTEENLLPNLPETLKKSFSSTVQESNRSLVSSTAIEHLVDSSNTTNSFSLKNNSQAESLERLLGPNYLILDADAGVESQLLSDTSMFLNGSQNSVQDMDVSLHSELNQNSSTNDLLLSSALQSDPDLLCDQINVALTSGRVNTYTQVPSVPQSPNTRRRAFNFLPISPRHTPVPEGMHVNGTSSLSSPHLRTMMSTAVGPSQPPSNSGSPFVSPRSTPVPLCRSRHSSGQSTYSTSRHTPFQNFDSGVSSVSSSPFISPQPTPIPVSRLRHNSSHGCSKTVTFCSVNSPQVINSHSLSNNVSHMRTRHSSGPGAPYITASSPCSSLSPLVTEQCTASSFIFPSNNEIRSRHNSGSNTTTPLSPVSEQASSSSSCASNIPDLTSISESQSFLNDAAGDLLISANPSSFKQVRQRHVSSSAIYGKSSSRDILSQEIQKLLRNNPDNGSSDLVLSNRSQSVPLHQMLQTADGFCFLTQPMEDPNPKSHPSTPVMNQMFSFPLLGSNADSLGVDAMNRDNKSAIQNSQMDWVGFEGSDLENPSARRNLSVLYDAPPPPLSDDLQATLEDLRDCDTDFSKLELELRQSEDNCL